jgi:histidine triad (HIT) family protein
MPDAIIATCLFCKIVSGEVAARIVFEDEHCLAFLDHRPVFPGHCLLIPKQHHETLADLPDVLIHPFFKNAQLLSRAVERAMEAHGTFVAMNNRVSQSVPHLHLHIVPRRRKDGLKGFFWPRFPYPTPDAADTTQKMISEAIASLIWSDKKIIHNGLVFLHHAPALNRLGFREEKEKLTARKK